MHTARKMKFWAETPTSSIKKYEPPFECILHINQKASIFSKMWFEILDMKLSYLSEFIAFTKFTLEGHGINKPSVRFPSKKIHQQGKAVKFIIILHNLDCCHKLDAYVLCR